nr:uncharacterized protein C3orf30 homolog [Meriones unguiculatus]
MDEPPGEAPDGSFNQENIAQSPDNQKTQGEAGQATHRGSKHPEDEQPEPSGDKTPSQAANTRSGQTDQGASEELTDHRSPGSAEIKASQQVDHKISEPPSQQIPRKLEGKVREEIEVGMSLPSSKRASEQTDQSSSYQTDSRMSGKSQPYSTDDYEAEDFPVQPRFREDKEADYERMGRATENDTDSYYKPFAQGSLPETFDNNEAAQKIQPCTFEDSQIELRSRASTGETESSATVQIFPHESEIATDFQFSREKLPHITSKTYYFSNQEAVQGTENTTNAYEDFEQRKGFQRHSQAGRRRFPPIVYEDPYQIALRYMEKHNILQIFQQITENLVYEKPDDPLDFMLGQVQEMIRERDERRNI